MHHRPCHGDRVQLLDLHQEGTAFCIFVAEELSAPRRRGLLEGISLQQAGDPAPALHRLRRRRIRPRQQARRHRSRRTQRQLHRRHRAGKIGDDADRWTEQVGSSLLPLWEKVARSAGVATNAETRSYPSPVRDAPHRVHPLPQGERETSTPRSPARHFLFSENIFYFSETLLDFRKVTCMLRPSRPTKRGGSRSSRNAGRDAVDADGTLTSVPDAYGEVVW